MAFQNQIGLAEKIINDWENNRNIKKIAIVAECQSGKTGLLIELARRIKCIVEKRRQNFRYFILGPSDVQLAKQTEERFSDKKITSPEEPYRSRYLHQKDDIVFYPQNIHNLMSEDASNKVAYSNYQDWIDRIKEDNFFLFIHDEAHRDSGIRGKISNLCSSFKTPALNYPEADNSLMIYVTATPTQDMTTYLKDEEILQYYMRPGDGYTSLKMLCDAGRILRISPNIKNTKQSLSDTQLNQIESEVLPKLRAEYPQGGHFIWRVSKGLDITRFKTKLANDNKDLTFCAFVSKQTDIRGLGLDKKNIDELEIELLKPINNINICFIIGSFRQGKTIDKLQNVIGWYDSSSSGSKSSGSKSEEEQAANDALIIQSVGRNCGYGKIGLNYKIWCNISSIRRAIKFYDTYENPSNNYDQPGAPDTDEERAIAGTFSKRSYNKENTYFAKLFDNEQEVREYRRKRIKDGFATGRAGGTINTCSEQNVKDVAEEVLKDQYGQFFAKDGGSCCMVHVDGPNKNHMESWIKLKSEYIGKYIYAEKSGTFISTKFNATGSGYHNNENS